jgi:glutamate-1-semialdehyde 2,1-aminomutase
MTIESPAKPDLSNRLDELIAEEEAIFVARQPRSRELRRQAESCLAGGVTSSWQITAPQAVWMSHGLGSKIYDVDGGEYVDLHGGYGAGLAGHAHPAIVEAVRTQVGQGTHFAQPTESAIEVAEELTRRFHLPLWRFNNSGTEATMDAVHLMRAITGRDLVIKIEGCYHGHHDSVQVSVMPDEDDMGPADSPASASSSNGIPRAIVDLTLIAPYNDLAAVERLLEAHPGQVAGMILEPVMMNAGIIRPLPGYLEGLKALLHRHDALLTFDEVKTGLTAGPSGAIGYTGVTPDILCLAKAIGGGIASAAVGGTEEVMAYVADGTYEMVGTFNGNPLAMAATKAMLTEVLTDEAYQRLDALQAKAVAGVEATIARYGLSAHVVGVGAKGCIVFQEEKVNDYRGFMGLDDRFNHAHWLMQHNGGVFLPPWGKMEQWLISAQHDDADIDRFLANFERLAAALTA